MPETAEACFNVTVMCPFGILGGVPLGAGYYGYPVPLEAICDAYPIWRVVVAVLLYLNS